MLKSLYISNYAIIDEVNISLDEGLSIITGETGAGKSILLGALGLVMGKRAETGVLYSPDKKCVVEAVYNITDYKLHGVFESAELDYDDECIIRREIQPSGKSRAFVNDTPVNLGLLRKISTQLVDLHQQFDQLEINEEQSQINALDAMAGNGKSVHKYAEQYNEFRQVSREIESIKSQATQDAQEEDFLKFQLSEFEQLQLEKGEVEALETEIKKLNNSEEISRVGGLIESMVSNSEQSIIEQLDELVRELRNITNVDESASNLRDHILNIKEELEDVANQSSQMADSVEYDPERILEIEGRLDAINRLLNKYRVATTDELLKVEEELADKYSSIKGREHTLGDLESKKTFLEEELKQKALVISKERKRGAELLSGEINNILNDLSMKNAELRIDISSSSELRSNGIDLVNFLFSANKGGSFQPLSKVASGGELSRINLALKSTIAGALTLPTLIFDEIDSGVSGQVALMMGKILNKLSQKHQTICITHSPQIAARADTHYRIFKSDKENRTFTHIEKLNVEERKLEIAKMLSGDPPSSEAINNAEQLMKQTV